MIQRSNVFVKLSRHVQEIFMASRRELAPQKASGAVPWIIMLCL
jgi:hypothetical protein